MDSWWQIIWYNSNHNPLFHKHQFQKVRLFSCHNERHPTDEFQSRILPIACPADCLRAPFFVSLFLSPSLSQSLSLVLLLTIFLALRTSRKDHVRGWRTLVQVDKRSERVAVQVVSSDRLFWYIQVTFSFLASGFNWTNQPEYFPITRYVYLLLTWVVFIRGS